MDLLEREELLLQKTDLTQYNYISSLQQKIRTKKAEMRLLQQEIDALEYTISKQIPSTPLCRVDQLRESLESYNRDLRIAYLTGEMTRKEFISKLSRRRKKYMLFEQAVFEELSRLGLEQHVLNPLGKAAVPDTESPPRSE